MCELGHGLRHALSYQLSDDRVHGTTTASQPGDHRRSMIIVPS